MTPGNTVPIIATEKDFRRAVRMLKKLNFAKYTPSLVALIGSQTMVLQLIEEIKVAVKKNSIDGQLRKRLQKLLEQFIPQIAEMNGVKNLSQPPTTQEIKALFENAEDSKMLQGENKIFLRVIHHSLKNMLETIPE